MDGKVLNSRQNAPEQQWAGKLPLAAQNPQNEASSQPQGGQRLAKQKKAKQQLDNLNYMAEMSKKMQEAPPKIGEEQIAKASQILGKYKAGKANLERKIIANEQFWKLRQWNFMDDGKPDFKPATSWLWSCIQSRYSDVMDSYPTCNIQPRQQDDKAEAKKLSAIIPIILRQNKYEKTYSDTAWYALKQGGVVQGVFWDSSKHNGLGDIAIKKIDFINLFWEPGITDIQESTHLFHTELVNNDLLEQRYPQCRGRLGGQNITLAKYLYDDNVDTTDKSVVVDWYYHTEYEGRRVLQYCKYVNNIVLYATENDVEIPTEMQTDPETGMPVARVQGEPVSVRGLYDHGLYPFVVMSLYPIEGSICGLGLTDIGRDTQLQIDKLNKAITDNAVIGATPRYFIKHDGAVNEAEYADLSKTFIHVESNLGEENIRPIDRMPLDSIYVDYLGYKVDELKFITSNQDSNNGIAPSGVTAASAIAALQESAGKNARSSNKVFHNAFCDVVYQVIELIRQFYTAPRTFRIAPESGSEEFVQYSNANLVAQPQMTMGMDMGLRMPEFDIEVTAEKANPYKKMEINELALSFYGNGFFNPQMADQAVACLQMMDFAQKDEVIQRIKQNGTLYELMLNYQNLALQLAAKHEPEVAEQIAMGINQNMGGGQPFAVGVNSDLDTGAEEHPMVEKARTNARASTEAE